MSLKENIQPKYYRSIKKDFFKSDLYALYIICPLTDRDAAMGALLGNILSCGSKKYPSIRELAKKEEELFGTYLFFDMNKYGDQLVFEAKMLVPSQKYLPNKSLRTQAEDFFMEVFKNPIVEDGRFNEEIFQREKQNLYQEIVNLEKETAAYTHRRCVENIYEDDPMGIYKYGSKESVAAITSEELYSFYKKLLANENTYFYEHGSFDDSKHVEKQSVPSPKLPPRRDEPLIIVEEQEAMQSVLELAYTTPVLEGDQVYAMSLLSMVLGSGSGSRFFQEVREAHGYCYYIYSSYDRYRSLMFIHVGFEYSQKDELIDSIEKIILDVQENGVTQEQLSHAKTNFIQALKSLSDRQISSVDYSFIRDLFSYDESVEERIAKIEAVEAGELQEIAKTLKLHTQMLVKGVGNGR